MQYANDIVRNQDIYFKSTIRRNTNYSAVSDNIGVIIENVDTDSENSRGSQTSNAQAVRAYLKATSAKKVRIFEHVE
jgi:hypothetical protein